MNTELAEDQKSPTDRLSLTELEDLALQHMEHDQHVIRNRGQVEVARELRSLAFSNIADLMTVDVEGVLRLKDLTELPREVTATIKKIKVKRDRVKGPRIFDTDGTQIPNHSDMTGEVVEIELWSKEGALDKLMKHYGGYSEDNKQKSQDNGAANLDILMGAIASKGMPQLYNDPHEDRELTEDDI